MSNRRSARLGRYASNAPRDGPVGKIHTLQRSRLSKGPSLTVSLLAGGPVKSLETREPNTAVARSPAYACVSEGELCTGVCREETKLAIIREYPQDTLWSTDGRFGVGRIFRSDVRNDVAPRTPP